MVDLFLMSTLSLCLSPSKWFEKKIEEYDMLDTHLKYLHQATEDLSSYCLLYTSDAADE